MKIITAVLCVALMASCNKKRNNDPYRKSSEDSLSSTVKKDSLSLEKDPLNVEEIKKEFTVINDKLLAKKLDSSGFNYYCEEREGTVSFYYEKQKLKMVKHFSADSHFSSLTNYFIKNDQVFFIFNEDTLWQFDGGTPEKPITKDSISQQRIYLTNGNPLECLEKNFTIRSIGNNVNPEKVPNKKGKCNTKDLMATYQKILKNKNIKGKAQCL